jgi:cyanoexosortase A
LRKKPLQEEMRTTKLTAVKRLYNQKFWLLAIGAGLVAIHLTLTWKSENSDLLGTSFLYWLAVCFLVFEKHDNLNLESGIVPSFLGLSLIVIALIKSATMTSFGGFLYLLPLVFALGLALIASGFKGLKQYGGELLALFFIALPKLLPTELVNITPFTAKLSAFMLWYTGFEVNRSGLNIYLPNGSIEVASGCSGIELISQMLGLALLFLLMFPQKRKQKIIVPIVAATLGFIVNSARVALMAFIVTKDDMDAFDYWHSGDGSLIFSMIAVLLFGLFCWFLIEHNEPKNKASRSS